MGWLVDQSVFNRRGLLFWQFPKCMTINEQQIYTNYQAIYPATSSLTVYSTNGHLTAITKRTWRLYGLTCCKRRTCSFQRKILGKEARGSLIFELFWTDLSFRFCWVSEMRCVKHEKWGFTIYHLSLDPRISWSNEHPKQIGWRCFQMKYLQTAGCIFNSPFISNIEVIWVEKNSKGKIKVEINNKGLWIFIWEYIHFVFGATHITSYHRMFSISDEVTQNLFRKTPACLPHTFGSDSRMIQLDSVRWRATKRLIVNVAGRNGQRCHLPRSGGPKG